MKSLNLTSMLIAGTAATCALSLLCVRMSGRLPAQVVAASHSTAVSEGARVPVLVELFTSEGCSSCPPADALLRKLDETQFVPGAEAIVLSEHVTYWDDLSWKDPFAMKSMTQHQQQYAARFGLSSVYTPQAVVDGAAQLVGSDERGLTRAIAQAAAEPKIDLSIGEAGWSEGRLQFTISSNAKSSNAILIAALAEDVTGSSVLRGENAGRTLRHVAVVRTMQELPPDWRSGRKLTLSPPDAQADGSSHNSPMRLVVFMVDRHTRHVLGIAEQAIHS